MKKCVCVCVPNISAFLIFFPLSRVICAEPWAGGGRAYGDGMLNLSEFLVADNSEDGESITVERKKKGKSSREYPNPPPTAKIIFVCQRKLLLMFCRLFFFVRCGLPLPGISSKLV